MAVILKADFVVGLALNGRVVINELLKKENEPIEFTITDCLEKQRLCITSGYGNVVACSTANDFRNFLQDWKYAFQSMPKGTYIYIKDGALYDPTCPNNINYEKLLTLGIYNSAHFDTFYYPRNHR